ncbi:immunoglobulin E-set [Aspergillus floccosus]
MDDRTAVLSGRPVIVKALEISSPSLATPIKFDTTATAVGNVINKGQTIKEGAEYTLSLTFEVDQQVNGLTFRQTVKRAGLTVSDVEKTVGDYPPLPNGAVYTVAVYSETAPSGILARSGHYTALCKVTGENCGVVGDFQWTYKIGKDWSE